MILGEWRGACWAEGARPPASVVRSPAQGGRGGAPEGSEAGHCRGVAGGGAPPQDVVAGLLGRGTIIDELICD